MTKLEFINKAFFQWFFVRLTKHMKQDDDGNYTIVEKYTIMGFIVPLTGWFSNYIFIGKRWNISCKWIIPMSWLFILSTWVLVIIYEVDDSILFKIIAILCGIIGIGLSYSNTIIHEYKQNK